MRHVGAFPELEDELCSWQPSSGMRSPNRLDSLVWALTELMPGDVPGPNLLESMQPQVAAKASS